MWTRSNRAILVGLATLALAASACGGGGGASGDGSEASTPSSATAAEGDLTDGESVKVAGLYSTSGEYSTFDIDVSRGAEMAIQEINAEGFEVDGTTYTIDYETYDTASDPTAAPQFTQEAINGFGAQFVLGGAPSAMIEPIVSVVERSGGDVLLMAPATLLDQHVGQGKPIFRTLPPDPVTAAQVVPVLREEFPDVEQVSTIMINDAVGQRSVEVYEPEFANNGFEVVSSDLVPADETNFAPLIQRVPDGTDAIFVGYTDAVSTAVVEAAIEAGLPTIFFNQGSACQVGMDFGEEIEAYTCRIFTEDPFNPSSDRAEQFFAEYERQYDTERNSNTLQALYMYDYVFTLVEAMKAAGTVEDVSAVAEAMRGISYDGVLKVHFDEGGVNQTPLKVGIVRRGEMTVVSADG